MTLLIILPLNTLIPLYITLNEKLEVTEKRDCVFPKELLYRGCQKNVYSF